MSPLLLRVLLPLLTAAAGAGACAKKSGEVPGTASAAPNGSEQAAKGGEAAKGEDNTPPPGVDLTKLDEFERKVFFRVMNKESSACGKAESLLKSVKTDRGCRKSLYAARYVVRLIDGGYTDSEISESIQKRFRTDAGEPGPGRQPDQGDRPAPR